MSYNWELDKIDIEIIEKIRDQIPDKVFDMHTHILRPGQDVDNDGGIFCQGPPEITINTCEEWSKKIYGENKEIGMLAIPFVSPGRSAEDVNRWAIDQVKGKKNHATELFVTPQMDPVAIESLIIENTCVKGFKPYHTFSSHQPTFESCIYDYLPEWCLELANKYKLVITLHIVKEKAVADIDNIEQICEICTRYPDLKLILAHAARGFNYYNNFEGLKQLHGCDNLYFDISAVCQPQAITAVLKVFGPGKMVLGSDFPVNMVRGKCVQIGDNFIWIDTDNFDFSKVSYGIHPVLVAVESLRAAFEAFDDFGLDQKDIEDVFWNNAVRLLDFKNE